MRGPPLEEYALRVEEVYEEVERRAGARVRPWAGWVMEGQLRRWQGAASVKPLTTL
jgi:hypothetical protein